MNLSVQRYKNGHPNYTDKVILFEGKKYGTVLGEMKDTDTGKFICYTMERLDTLIPDGAYDFTFHNSPSNKAICPHIYNDALGVGKPRYILIHVANWAYQLKGCTATGTGFDKNTPSLTGSKTAFTNLMALLKNKNGKINYKTY